MRRCGQPQNLPESFGLVISILGFSGLFPFHFDAAKNKFIISRKYFSLTIVHITMYTYVNITSLMENWKDFAQPMMGNSSLTAFGNLILRLASILITFLILPPLLFGSRTFVTSLNYYVQIVEEYIKLGIDVKCIYRRIYFLSIFVASSVAVTLVFTAWHSIYFYELITLHPPAFKYYLMAFLANFYKILFLSYGNVQLVAIYLISQQLNGFVDTLLQRYQEDYEKQRIIKELLRKKDLRKW